MGNAALAERLIDAHRRHASFAWSPALEPSSIEEAYRIQDAVLRALEGDRLPVAWKVSPARNGVGPLASPVPASGVSGSPAFIAAGPGIPLGIEAEIAFRLGGATDSARGSVQAAEAFVLVEVCSTRFSNWEAAGALARLADFQSHGAFVVGSGTRDLDRDFGAQGVELMVAGRIVASATGSHPTPDLRGMLAWAIDHCVARGTPLRAGDIVTTGSWTGLTRLPPGQEAIARFAGIGEARLVLA